MKTNKHIEEIMNLSNKTGYDANFLFGTLLEMLEEEAAGLYESVFHDFKAITTERDW